MMASLINRSIAIWVHSRSIVVQQLLLDLRRLARIHKQLHQFERKIEGSSRAATGHHVPADGHLLLGVFVAGTGEFVLDGWVRGERAALADPVAGKCDGCGTDGGHQLAGFLVAFKQLAHAFVLLFVGEFWKNP